MKRMFIALAILMSFKSSSASATCYQASKCVVPFIPALNYTLGGDISVFFEKTPRQELQVERCEQQLSKRNCDMNLLLVGKMFK